MKTAEKYISEAKKYFSIAMNELEEAKKIGKIEKAVDGCEKGWISVILATKALFVSKGEEKLPRGHRGRSYLLKKHGTKEMGHIYYKARQILHIDGFYEQLIDYDIIFECMEEVKNYIETIERRQDEVKTIR